MKIDAFLQYYFQLAALVWRIEPGRADVQLGTAIPAAVKSFVGPGGFVPAVNAKMPARRCEPAVGRQLA
ncbi:MAG: hypothetical protein JO170_25985 [Verrucomicrobia bacterium]|nr:hypothetical protein [Verrucomicrobiota bacterium]